MPSLHQIASERQLVNDTIRSFFRTRGYVEVETPVIVRSPGMEPNLMPFETRVVEPNGTRHAAGLITSPEYAMKKLLGRGMKKIFTLTKVFRNDEDLAPSAGSGFSTHNPEFTMLEWYRQGADYRACMDETEGLVRAVCGAVQEAGGAKARRPQDWEEPFRRVRVRDLFLEHVGLDLDEIVGGADDPFYAEAFRRHNLRRDPSDTESDLFYRLFLSLVEPHLQPNPSNPANSCNSPLFLYDYPVHQAALSRLTPDGKYGERFELYADGLELCNAFTELVDADEQRRRFEIEAEERRALGKTVFPIDEELLRLLPNVQNPTFGNALGVDRLHMVAAGARSIEDVLLFPGRTLFVET